MRLKAALLAALLLAGCATTPRRQSHGGHWLVGTWLMLAEDIEHPLACASGLPIAYAPSGTYQLFDESGRWRLDGDRLTEIATEITDPGEEGVPEIGRLYVSRIERRGPDEFRKTFADGNTETFRRCPNP